MQKLKKNIISIILFLIPLVLLTLSIQGYWYKIHFSNGDVYLFKYSNIQISNLTHELNVTNNHFEYNNSSNSDSSSDNGKIVYENLSYGKALETQDVFFVCFVCTIVAIVCNLVIIILQLINIKVYSKHNLYLVNTISKMVTVIMICFNIGSTLYLLNFRSTFNGECKYLGNCLENSNNNSFIGDDGNSSFQPWYSWFFNCISIPFVLCGLILLFIKNKKNKQNKYQLLV